MSADQSTVEYRDIKGFPGYRVGNDGSVWSQKAGGDWKELKRRIGKGGYCRVVLYKPWSCLLVHRIVLEAFVGPCPEGMECRHFPDHTRSNCNLSNLQWGTRKQNAADRVAMGRVPRGEKQHLAVLTESLVRKLREEYAGGMGRRPLARKHGINPGTLLGVLQRKTWKHVVDS